MNDPFLLDCKGQRVYVGDYVRCDVYTYASIRRGENRRVKGIVDGNFILNNALSPNGNGTSMFRPERFILSGRYHKYHRNPDRYENYVPAEQENTKMLHIAVRIGNASIQEIVDIIGIAGMALPQMSYPPYTKVPVNMLIDTSAQALKNKVAARVQNDSAERWLILSANTIGESSAPPVRFRAV